MNYINYCKMNAFIQIIMVSNLEDRKDLLVSMIGCNLINLHRLRLMDPNSACNLLFSADYDSTRVPAGTTTFDLIVLVERLITLNLRLSSSDCSLIVSNGQK